MRSLVIVPAHNEVNNLRALAAMLRREAPTFDVCLVDDGSTDGTGSLASELGFRVLRIPMNLGIGGAVQTGYLWARDNGYDIAVQLDGDGQHEAGCIPGVVAPILDGNADLVVGSRFLGDGTFRSTASRRMAIRYLSWLLRLRCGLRITDATSGFRAANRRAIELFARSYPSDYPEPESVAIARRAGLRICEVPVRMREREHGVSSITAARAAYYMLKVSVALLLLPAASIAAGRHASEG